MIDFQIENLNLFGCLACLDLKSSDFICQFNLKSHKFYTFLELKKWKSFVYGVMICESDTQ